MGQLRDLSHTSSRKWASEEQKQAERWAAIDSNLSRLCPKSPFVPHSLNEYLELQAYMRERRAEYLRRKMETDRKEAEVRAWYESRGYKFYEPFNGRSFDFPAPQTEPRGAVLGQLTIWCVQVELKFEQAQWPSFVEMKWEGADRALTHNGRFLPLPRFPAGPAVAWHQQRLIQTYEMDQVWRVPDYEDVYHPVEEIPEEDIPMLLNSDLLAALDEDVY